MLEIRKTAIYLDARSLMELERIIMGDNEKEALRFVKKPIYERIVHAQQGRLKSHLEVANPAKGFKKPIRRKPICDF